jgi:hypothetical protein
MRDPEKVFELGEPLGSSPSLDWRNDYVGGSDTPAR